MSKKTPAAAMPENHLVVFQERGIRRAWHDGEWWFAIVDVVAVLTDSVQPEGYVKDLRRRDKELAKGWGQIATPLRIATEGGAQRVNCANTEVPCAANSPTSGSRAAYRKGANTPSSPQSHFRRHARRAPPFESAGHRQGRYGFRSNNRNQSTCNI